MTDQEDPFEEQLREALRSGSDRVDHPGGADDSAELLARVRRGAARRRFRRRAGGLVATAVVASAVVVTLPLLTPPPSSDETAHGPSAGDRPDQPSVSAGAGVADRREQRKRERPYSAASEDMPGRIPSNTVQTGVAVEVDDVKVTSVSGAGDDEFWVSGYGTCNEEDLCNVLGHSGNGGADLEFTTLPVGGHSRHTTVRFATDGTTGWATDGGEVYRTDTEGKSWIRLEQPAGVRVSDLDVWEDEVWAVGSRPASQETVVLASHRYSDELVNVQESRELAPVDAVALGSRTFGVRRVDPEANFSRTADGGSRWTAAEIGCQPADLSAADEAAWVLCDDVPALVRSTDQGYSWLPPEPLDSAIFETPSRIAAITADSAFVAGSGAGWVVENQVATPADGIGEGTYAYADFFTEDVGYLIGSDGHLCRSDDGGYSWERIELP